MHDICPATNSATVLNTSVISYEYRRDWNATDKNKETN